jgi:hypothetical protein
MDAKDDNRPLTWMAILKKDIELVSGRYSAGTIVQLKKDVSGRTHIVGYRSAFMQDDQWEMFWNEPAYQDLINKYDNR